MRAKNTQRHEIHKVGPKTKNKKAELNTISAEIISNDSQSLKELVFPSLSFNIAEGNGDKTDGPTLNLSRDQKKCFESDICIEISHGICLSHFSWSTILSMLTWLTILTVSTR